MNGNSVMVRLTSSFVTWKDNRMKVWTVEQGEYSDYRVVGIFSTKENAAR